MGHWFYVLLAAFFYMILGDEESYKDIERELTDSSMVVKTEMQQMGNFGKAKAQLQKDCPFLGQITLADL